MVQWRISTSQQAQDDFDDLFTTVLPFAIQTLERYGELHPFGATMTVAGATSMLAAAVGSGEAASDALEMMRAGVTADRSGLRASAYVADVAIPGGDAVQVELEHREGAAIVVVVPYVRNRLRRSVKTGEMHVQSGTLYAWSE